MRIGVTGTSSGLGAYLCTALGAEAIRRPDALSGAVAGGLDVLVHCAFDARKTLAAESLEEMLTSNLTLVERLLEVAHRRFVYVSSVEVYPRDGRRHGEDEPRQVDEDTNVTGLFKLAAEQLVLRRARRPLVLRCTSIVGPTARPNNIMRVLRGEPVTLRLDGTSRYNLVSMRQVEQFLRAADAAAATGVYNLGASDEATLADIAAVTGARPTYGQVHYEVPGMDTRRVRALCPAFERTTREVARDVHLELAVRPSSEPGGSTE